MRFRNLNAVLLGLAAAVISACKSNIETPFYDGIHHHASTIDVKVSLPAGATNAYLTTDNEDPIVSESCKLGDGIVTVNRPMVIKLRYDLDGQTVQQKGIYVIADQIKPNRFGNRDAIEIFESFIKNHLNPAFGPTSESFDQTLTITDDQGGSATRATDIEGIIFKEGRQTFSFNNYHYFNSSQNTLFVAENGKIFGFIDSDGGYYNTDDQGETMVFSGTYTGTAEGHFYLNEYRQTTGGFYRVTCVDRWCATGPVYYALDGFREFVEIYPLPDEAPKSCN